MELHPSNNSFWGSLRPHLLYNLATSVGLTFRHKLVGECENNRSSFSELGFSRNRNSLAIGRSRLFLIFGCCGPSARGVTNRERRGKNGGENGGTIDSAPRNWWLAEPRRHRHGDDILFVSNPSRLESPGAGRARRSDAIAAVAGPLTRP